ncbi:WD40 repeat domain-containing serine/threonine protein kinase [Streptomyces sp. NPDC127108]|uniref:WD40 repeat domain-containing serine/threonine protein kinase n=1 Tax=Streptomyces sp. NPDC127108 TaxID=3345361 RepID=UPI003633F8D6
MELSGVTLAGRYELKELLGRGGMGEVWLGRDRSLLRRDVAVKVLPTPVRTDAVRRFQREAATLAGLQHPGITVVHDAGEHDGFLFIVMELLRGQDVARLMAGHRAGLPVGRAVDLARQTAVALAAAHESGVVHRDLKPGNLFVRPGDQIKICDFGIARSADASAVLTTVGRVVGTPLYMAPEQWRAEDPAAPADLYSLGCVLYELLTGRPPFTADASLYALMHHHVTEVPRPPRELRPELPAPLADLVLALLAKDPGDRPDAAALARELAAPSGTAEGAADARPTAPAPAPRRRARGSVLTAMGRSTLSGHRTAVLSLAFSPDGGLLASGGGGNCVRLWDPDIGEAHNPLPMGSSHNALVVFSPDGRTLATGCGRYARLWDRQAFVERMAVKYPGWSRVVSSVAFSPDGRTLATGGSDGAIRLWDAHTGFAGREMRWPGGWVTRVAFSPDGLGVAGGGQNKTTLLWDVATGEPRWEIPGRTADTALAFSPDGTVLATAPRGDLLVHLKDPDTGKDRRAVDAHAQGATALAFSPDGHILATAGRDGLICLWDPDTGDQRIALTGHAGEVLCLAFSPDGRTLASGGQDRVIRLWDITTGQ